MAPIRLLAMGDSLTAGMTNGQFFPYTDFLPADRFMCTNRGACGELTSEIVARLQHEMEQEAYDAVVLLAGTNDLGCLLSPAEALENLWTAAKLVVESAASTLVLSSLPALGCIHFIGRQFGRAEMCKHIATRLWLNDKLLLMSLALREAFTNKTVMYADFFTATSEPFKELALSFDIALEDEVVAALSPEEEWLMAALLSRTDKRYKTLVEQCITELAALDANLRMRNEKLFDALAEMSESLARDVNTSEPADESGSQAGDSCPSLLWIPVMNKELDGDGLHLNKEGYRLMAECVAVLFR